MAWEFYLPLILAIPLGILANFATPWLKSYVEKGSLSLRERRLYLLRKRYRYIVAMREDPARLNFIMFKQIAWGLLFLTLLVTGIGIFLMPPVSQVQEGVFNQFSRSFTFYAGFGYVIFCGYMIFSIMYKIIQDISDMIDFDEYKKKIMTQMQNLGANIEELEQGETKA